MKTTTPHIVSLALLTLALTLTGCSTAPPTGGDKQLLADQVRSTIARFKQRDPSMSTRFERAAGYAVFPEVGKGGLIVGGAYGRGLLYEGGEVVGYVDLTQGSLGLQAGGQTYSEVVFMQDARDVERFKYEDVSFSAQASAVAATAGSSADANYRNGLLVFTLPTGGLMGEASVGGQRFTFVPR